MIIPDSGERVLRWAAGWSEAEAIKELSRPEELLLVWGMKKYEETGDQ